MIKQKKKKVKKIAINLMSFVKVIFSKISYYIFLNNFHKKFNYLKLDSWKLYKNKIKHFFTKNYCINQYIFK